MDLNILKTNISSHTYQEDWLGLSTLLGITSNKIQLNKPIETELSMIIYFLLSVAYNHDINLQTAWHKWKKKAYQKVYSSK